MADIFCKLWNCIL